MLSLVVGSKPWNYRVFQEVIVSLPGEWHFIQNKDELTLENLQRLKPHYLFFLHWSWKVPEDIIKTYECVCFHMTDVPYGRGGSPLQNLIVRGHRQTKLTALRMTEAFDAGPVYLKQNLSLEGNAEEIYIRATYLSAHMIETIVRDRPIPIPQTGDVTVFKRRQPQDSEVPSLSTLAELHDFIRMLDATGYPKAFFERDGFRYEFSRAALYDGKIMADVVITPVSET